MIYKLLHHFFILLAKALGLFSEKLRVFLKEHLDLSYLDKLSVADKESEYYWVHCASVGEVNLSQKLVQKLANHKKIIISTITSTGYNNALTKYSGYGKQIMVIYFPIDSSLTIKKIIKTLNIKKLILVETEIWPNLINICHKFMPIYLINGRISDRSLPRYKKIKFLIKPLLKKITHFMVQSNEDKKRFIELGARADRVEVSGNLKFDIHLKEYSKDDNLKLREQLGLKDNKIFVAGSTRPGEEEIILKAFSKAPDNYTLILVPRHPERALEIRENLLEGKFSYILWSDSLDETPNSSKGEAWKVVSDKKVILVDVIGVLTKLYAISDLVFVGGTLVNIGGHSILEPLFYHKPPLFGPHTQNIKDIAKEVLKLGIGYQVKVEDDFLAFFKGDSTPTNDTPKTISVINEFLEANCHSTELTYNNLLKEI